jgi:O-antigen/teichoic acid export membrane protein
MPVSRPKLCLVSTPTGPPASDEGSEQRLGDDVRAMPRAEMRRRSLAGVFYLSSSNVANLLVGLMGSLVLARVLTPEDFGVVAIGSTAILIAGALADGGLGAGMVKRAEPPTIAELRTMNGIQLSITLAVCIPALVVALFFGRTGLITAVMILSLPITTLQTPGRIMLTRTMRYDRQLAIDFGAQVASQSFAVTAVLLGAGVWGLAIASVVKAFVGTVLTGKFSIGINMPSLRGWRGYGEQVKFGLSFQSSWFMFMAREQGLNIVVGAAAGVGSLGIWTFTNRIFQLPLVAFSSLYQVGFPAMASLLARGENPGPAILRTVRRTAVAGTFVFPVFAATSPRLIAAVFGGQWQDSARIVPFICLSTLILGSISVSATSYLAAAGRPGILGWASASLGVVWLAVTAPLLPFIGVTAIGVGNLTGALLEAGVLTVATKRLAGVWPHKPLIRPLAVALVAGTAGWWLCATSPPGLLSAVAAGALTIALNLIGLWLLCRKDLEDTIGLATGAVRTAVPGLGRAAAGSA